MSQGDVPSTPDPGIEFLVAEFGALAPGDQDLVMALIARLREPVEAEGYAPDVAFIDFDE